MRPALSERGEFGKIQSSLRPCSEGGALSLPPPGDGRDKAGSVNPALILQEIAVGALVALDSRFDAGGGLVLRGHLFLAD